MKKLFDDLITWFKPPEVDMILDELWNRKKTRVQVLKRVEATQQSEESRKKIEEEAYFLWEADGKPEGKEEYYWRLAIEKIKGQNIPSIQPCYLSEKRRLDPTNNYRNKERFFAALGKFTLTATIATAAGFLLLHISVGEKTRRNQEVFAAWATVRDDVGRRGAMKFLNSRPLRFPYIGTTKEGLYWDEEEKKCTTKRLWGERWERQSMASLSAPYASLPSLRLCQANLRAANFQGTMLTRANLPKANLKEANLQRANLQEAILWGANLGEANLQRANLKEANLYDANLRKANLQQAILDEANLQEAILGEANLQQAILDAANLQEAALWDANLQQAALWEANLQQANLGEANLRQATLWQANLQQANLWQTDLQRAILWEANLQETILGEANLQEAILVDAKNLTPREIKSACFWEEAIYKGDWNEEKETWEAVEPDNTKFIEGLKKDTASDPKYLVDCTIWEKH